jgi:branched-subunit amino acid ABC-type transport system permease component
VIGAIIIAEMEMIIGFFFAPVLTTFAYFVIFLAILMIRPAGLFGYVERRA